MKNKGRINFFALYCTHSLVCFLSFLESLQLRLIDIFRTLDHDRSGKITRQEFTDGVLVREEREKKKKKKKKKKEPRKMSMKNEVEGGRDKRRRDKKKRNKRKCELKGQD